MSVGGILGLTALTTFLLSVGIVIAVFLLMGVIGANIAEDRGNSRFAGFLWGLILGPIGILYVWTAPHRYICPECQEGVKPAAQRCPHCQQELAPMPTTTATMFALNPFISIFLIFAAILLGFVILLSLL
ncbi:MAG: hypothetical protein OXT69_08460 [Candidatus Poribacteria bacterium]|nr:hypothetical protein [Candidatus Poribacteria bacterium]